MKEAEAALDRAAYEKYPHLTEAEIKALVVDDKWLATVGTRLHGEIERLNHALAQRLRTLAERYQDRLPDLSNKVAALEAEVTDHLKRMGFAA